MRVRHVHGRAFVAHIYNADALARHMVPDWLYMSPLQTENPVDPTGSQESRYPGGAGLRIGVQILRYCTRLVHHLPQMLP
jgi:hypothetical protein